jgi:hypothetical protein
MITRNKFSQQTDSPCARILFQMSVFGTSSDAAAQSACNHFAQR